MTKTLVATDSVQPCISPQIKFPSFKSYCTKVSQVTSVGSKRLGMHASAWQMDAWNWTQVISKLRSTFNHWAPLIYHALKKDRKNTYTHADWCHKYVFKYSILTVRIWKSTEQGGNTSSKMSNVWIVRANTMCQVWKHILEWIWPLWWRTSNSLYAMPPSPFSTFLFSHPHHL